MAFKKGWKGGPGRPRRIPEIKQYAQYTGSIFNSKSLTQTISKYLFMPHTQLKEVVKTEHPSLDLCIAMIVYNTISKGDVVRMEWLCMRAIGRVSEKVEVALPQATIIQRIGGGEFIMGAVLKDSE